MKKFIYSILIFFVLLVVAIVVAANSSWVIKKAADKFAPEYKISYDDITGNVFTGVNIAGLKFEGKEITKNIKFSWNPSKILYKRVAINEISGEDLDVDTVKALIASFPKSTEETNETSSPLPVVITVDKVRLSVKPFVEQGITIEKTVLNVEDVTYASDGVSVDKLFLKIDSNVTDLMLYASLDDGKLVVEELSVKNIDSVTLEKMFLSKVPENENALKDPAEKKNSQDQNLTEKREEMNPLIPTNVVLKHFVATLKPRPYKTATVDKLEVVLAGANADVVKILKNEKNALTIEKYSLVLRSDIGQADLEGDLKNAIVTLNDVSVKKVDSLLLKTFFENKDSAQYDMDSQKEESKKVVKKVVKENVKEGYENQNNLIPEKVVLKRFHTDLLPSVYEPVKIGALDLDMEDVILNVKELVLEKGVIDLNGSSNFSNIQYRGTVKDNEILGPIVISPNKELFTFYNLPIRKDAIGDIVINIDASKEQVVADLKAKARQLLIVEKPDSNSSENNTSDSNTSKAFNVDIDSLSSHVVYTVKDNTLTADTKTVITTPYAKNITLTNKFLMDKNMSYSGEINAAKVIGIDAKMVKPLNDFKIRYDGTLTSVNTQISAEGLKGSFVSKDMKKGHFHLESKEAIHVGQLVALPAELNATKVNIFVDAPIDFNDLSALKGQAKITSNVANVDADLQYGKKTKLTVTTTIPKDSLLINFDKNVRYSAISPLVTTVIMGDKDIALNVKSSKINADVLMKPFKKTVDGKIRIAGMTATLDAKPNGDIAIKSDVGSFNALLDTINQFYTMENLPKIDGKLDVSVLVKKNQDVTLSLSSPEVIYHADRKTDHVIEDVKVVLGKKGSQIRLNAYQLTYNKMKVFSTKPSIVDFDKENVLIKELWLNDQLKVTGQLDTKKMKGEILADAPTFHLAHEMIDLDAGINIKTVMDGNKTAIDGKVTLLGGDIHYDLATKTFPSDSDIIIVQEMKKEEPSAFMDNLTIAVNIDTKQPLVFKQGPINVQSKVNLGVHKAIYSDPMIIGSVDLVDGGSYVFQGKKFVLENSHVYFTGDPGKPMLDITVKYKTIKNSLITINITGTPAVPNILFSSVPSMTKEQILSIILFDSEEGAGSNSGEDMMKMMGGAMAKSALSNLGVKLDHLVIGEGNSVEVGKKISDKVTVIYINGDIPEMKVKYDYSPSVEAVVGASERSESADVVYKKDFSADDIVIFGR